MDEGTGNILRDASSNHNDGTINGAVWTTGKSGGALSFDGVDDWVSIPQTFVFHQPTDATLIFWIKPDDAAHRSIFWTKGTGADTNRFNIYSGYFTSQGQIGFDYRSEAGALHDLARIPIPLNQWTHIAVARSGNKYSFYKDGQFVTEVTDNNPNLPAYTGNWYIGRRADNLWPDYLYKGAVDEVAMYNRALSVDEIYQIYQQLISPSSPPTLPSIPAPTPTLPSIPTSIPTPTPKGPDYSSSFYPSISIGGFVRQIGIILTNNSGTTITINKVELLNSQGKIIHSIPESRIAMLSEQGKLINGSSFMWSISFQPEPSSEELKSWTINWHGTGDYGARITITGNYQSF